MPENERNEWFGSECDEPGSTVYVADRDLNVVFTNLAWQQFASQNKGQPLLSRASYPNVLDSMSPEQAARWKLVYQLMLEGRLPCHREQFICSSPTEKRVFELRITPHRNDAGEIAWLVHRTARIDGESDRRLGEELQALDESIDRVHAEYQSRILLCEVRVPRYDCSQRQEPLEKLGGDLIWCRRYPNGVTDLVHADVAGHGEDAGRQATKIVAILDATSSPELGISDVLGRLNAILLEQSSDDATRFATGLYFRFGTEVGPLQCVNFGHLQPLFSRSGAVPLRSGLPVGIIEEVEPWEVNRIDPSEHGTRFLVYSDGITEQFNYEGDMFGVDRLWTSFREREHCPLDDMLVAVQGDIEQFRGAAIVKDDRTMLALELRAHIMGLEESTT